MKTTMKYLTHVLGGGVSFNPILPSGGAGLPLHLRKRRMDEVLFQGQKAILVELNSLGEITPAQLEKQKHIYESAFNLPVVFCFDELQSFERKRLIERQISFVIKNKQIYIPAFALILNDHKSKSSKKPSSLSPAAQFLLLYHLQKESLNGKVLKQLKDSIGYYSAMTLSRVANQFEAAGFCKLSGTTEKWLVFELTSEEIWRKAIPFLKSPVKKTIYINQLPESDRFVISGDEALAHYTSLNPTGKTHFAIEESAWKEFDDKIASFPNEYGGSIAVEIWKYPPVLLRVNKNYADPLSLYLCYKDDEDERVQMALKELLGAVAW
ncbi:MAG: hypothetical protein AMXMBFR48_25870 [Ignavibacteriales bacterium]